MILHGRAGIWILSLSAESKPHEWAKRMSERYFEHEKIKFVSPSGRVMFCLFYSYWWNSYIKHNFLKFIFEATNIVQLKWSPIAKCLSQKCYETRIYSCKGEIMVTNTILTFWNRKYKYYCLYFSFITLYPSFLSI